MDIRPQTIRDMLIEDAMNERFDGRAVFRNCVWGAKDDPLPPFIDEAWRRDLELP
jgi:hypothetical protein